MQKFSWPQHERGIIFNCYSFLIIKVKTMKNLMDVDDNESQNYALRFLFLIIK